MTCRHTPGAALLMLLFTCMANAADHRVLDSGRVLFYAARSIQWLDNDRVLAVLMENETYTSPEGKTYGLQGIYVWNVKTNELKRHAGPGAGGICVGDGFVRYFKRAIERDKYDEIERYFGPFGQEKKVTFSGPINLDTCKLESELPSSTWVENIVAQEKERNGDSLRMIRLREEHGWLAIREGNSKSGSYRPGHPIAIYPPGREEKPIAIDTAPFEPWLAKDYDVKFLRFETFKGAYLLAVDDEYGTGREHSVLWWLYPDGRLQTALEHRRDKGWEQFFRLGIVPAKSGVLAIGGKTDPRNDKTGVYQRGSSGRPEMIDRGLVNRSGFANDHPLSPDGCKLAYGIHPKGFGNWPATYYLHVVDLCAGEAS